MSETPRRGTIVVDFDGTICEHCYPAFGVPIAGAREALERLQAGGFRIIIHTVRTSSWHTTSGTYDPNINGPDAVRAYLEHHHIPFDDLWIHDKPEAVLYIDDRSVRLVGNRYRSNWQKIADALIPRESRTHEFLRWLTEKSSWKKLREILWLKSS